MEERWKPKSAKAIAGDKKSRQPTLAVKPVGKNHFIPRWFIRDNWAVGDKVLRWRRSEKGWVSSPWGFGKWGYAHNLYSDRLEAYFGLLEGDAKEPIERLLDTKPLNSPQCEAFVGFLIIQLLRNPQFIEFVRRGIDPVIAELGHSDDPQMLSKAYETIFQNNDLYHRLAHPVMCSRWAIVRSEAPVFVLPDTFGIRGLTSDGLRLIVPLTPTACFVTLPARESEKRIVPRHLTVDYHLAHRISSALVHGSAQEFLSHPTLRFEELEAAPFSTILQEIADAVAARSDNEN